MKRINVDLAELQAFIRLAERRSFRMAAEDLGLSAPALSRLIARVEDRLGTRLFDRDTRNVALTPQGQGTGATHPPNSGVVAALLEGRADLGFTAGAPDASGRLSFRPLLEDAFLAVGRKDGPLAEERAYTWEELLHQPFIAMAPGTSVRALIDAACAQAGLVLQPRFEVAHLATAGALAAAGLGVAALPSLTLPVLGRSSLVVRELESPRMVRRIGIVQATGRTPLPAAREFRRLLEATDLPGLLAEAEES